MKLLVVSLYHQAIGYSIQLLFLDLYIANGMQRPNAIFIYRQSTSSHAQVVLAQYTFYEANYLYAPPIVIICNTVIVTACHFGS